MAAEQPTLPPAEGTSAQNRLRKVQPCLVLLSGFGIASKLARPNCLKVANIANQVSADGNGTIVARVHGQTAEASIRLVDGERALTVTFERNRTLGISFALRP